MNSISPSVSKETILVEDLILLIVQEQWNALRAVLSTNNGLAAALIFERDMGGTLLHLLCSTRAPPADIVRLIMRFDPEAASARDSAGRTPLHVAALSHAPYLILKLLVSRNPRAVTMVDADGRTPLILLCCDAENDDAGATEEGRQVLARARRQIRMMATREMIDTIRLLCDANLAMVAVEDVNGMGALEYAIVNKYHIEVVRIIMRRTKQNLLNNVESARREDLARLSRTQAQRTMSSMTRVA